MALLKPQDSPADPPADLLCPITQDLFVEPVVAEDGFTYDAAAITRWLQTNATSPMTRQPLGATLVKNMQLRSRLVEYREKVRDPATTPPSDWPAEDGLFPMGLGTPLAKKLSEHFMSTLGRLSATFSVRSVQRSVNKKVWKAYAEYRKTIGGVTREVYLVHGPSTEDNLTNILEKGFSLRRSSGGGALGKGIYGSNSLVYVLDNDLVVWTSAAKKRAKLIVSRFVLGVSQPGKSTLVAPPPGAHSTTATAKGGAVFCVYSEAACYPEFILTLEATGVAPPPLEPPTSPSCCEAIHAVLVPRAELVNPIIEMIYAPEHPCSFRTSAGGELKRGIICGRAMHNNDLLFVKLAESEVDKDEKTKEEEKEKGKDAGAAAATAETVGGAAASSVSSGAGRAKGSDAAAATAAVATGSGGSGDAAAAAIAAAAAAEVTHSHLIAVQDRLVIPDDVAWQAPWRNEGIFFRCQDRAEQLMRFLGSPVEGLRIIDGSDAEKLRKPTFMDVFKYHRDSGVMLFVFGGAVRHALTGDFAGINDVDVTFGSPPNVVAREGGYKFAPVECLGRKKVRWGEGQRVMEGDCMVATVTDCAVLSAAGDAIITSDLLVNLVTVDFACNSVLFDPVERVFIDISGHGLHDILHKRLRIPVPREDWQVWLHQNSRKIFRYWKMRVLGYEPASLEMHDFLLAETVRGISTVRDAVTFLSAFGKTKKRISYSMPALRTVIFAAFADAVERKVTERTGEEIWELLATAFAALE